MEGNFQLRQEAINRNVANDFELEADKERLKMPVTKRI